MNRRTCFLAGCLLLASLISVARAGGAPFEKEIQAFEAADQKQPPPRDAVLFIGSSTIRFWTSLAADFPKLTVINRGFGGSQIADSTRYADRIAIPYHPSRIVMYAGDNDIAAGKSAQQVLEDFQAFVKTIRAAMPDVPIDFISIKPSPSRWKLADRMRQANALIEQFTREQKKLEFVNLFPALLGSDGKPRPELFRKDGLHLNADGYAILVSTLKPHIEPSR